MRSLPKENHHLKPSLGGKQVQNKISVSKALKVFRRIHRQKGKSWRVSVKDGHDTAPDKKHWVNHENAMKGVNDQDNVDKTLVLAGKMRYIGSEKGESINAFWKKFGQTKDSPPPVFMDKDEIDHCGSEDTRLFLENNSVNFNENLYYQ